MSFSAAIILAGLMSGNASLGGDKSAPRKEPSQAVESWFTVPACYEEPTSDKIEHAH